MKSLAEFKALSYEEKVRLIKSIFAELAKHYPYFEDLHTYMGNHETEISDDFLDTSYDIAFKLHEKLQ